MQFSLKSLGKNLFLSVVIVSFSFQLLNAQERPDYALLWKISGKNLQKPSYVFGTMHVKDSRAFQFSDAVMPAIQSCKIFALEIHPDSTLIAMSKKTYDTPPSDHFKKLLSDGEYQRLVEKFEEINGFSFEDSALKDPSSIISLLIREPEREDDQAVFVDWYLLDQARTMQKQIAGLEDIYSQIDYYDNLSPEKQREYILDYLDGDVISEHIFLENLTKIYHTGDIYEIEETVNSYEISDIEFEERNEVMVNRMMQLMHKEPLFSAIGVAHLPGEKGVIQLLKNEGYTVTKVEAEFTGVADTFKVDESKMKWHTFIDPEIGYQVETPQPPNYSETFPGFTIHMYNGGSSRTNYGFFMMDMRELPVSAVNESELIDRFMTNMTESHNGVLTKQISEPFKGETKHIGYIEMDDGRHLQIHFINKEKILYFQSAETDEPGLNASTERFFNSLEFGTPEPIEERVWQTYTNPAGAFSVRMPGEPSEVLREIPNPEDFEGEPYKLNMYMAIDEEKEYNFIVRYNDMPVGYFLEDRDALFESVVENLVGKASLISGPETIELDGHEGREMEVNILDKSHSILRTYLRGNRTYVLLMQSLTLDGKASKDHEFFKSFRFKDYEQPETITLKPEDDSFEVMFFEGHKVTKDSVDYDSGFTKNSVDYFTKNPSSGGVYQIGYGDLQDYFKIKNKEEFFENTIDAYIEWTDSISSQREVKSDGYDAKEYFIENTYSKTLRRIRIWLANKRFYIMGSFLGPEELKNDLTDSIYNSFKSNPTVAKDFDYFSSKTDLILKDLHSNDTIRRNRAYGAFDYYEFEESDLPKLYEALKADYEDEDYGSLAKKRILYEFNNISDSTTLEQLRTFYKSTSDNGMKQTIISTIPDLSNENRLDVYKELMDSAPPTELEDYSWEVLSPFRDSLDFAVDNYRILSNLIKYRDYRSSVLNISSSIADRNEADQKFITNNLDNLMQHANEDLSEHLKALKDSLQTDYSHYGLVNGYLSLLNSLAVNTKATDDFTSRLIKESDAEWQVSRAIIARIRSKQKVDDKLVNQYLDSLDYRFDLMKAYHDVNSFKAIKKDYKTPKSFATLSLYNYFYDNDYYPSEMKVLGEIKKEGKTYYAMELNLDDESPYLAVVGPIETLSQEKELQLYEVYTDWDYKEEDWKTQAENLVQEENGE